MMTYIFKIVVEEDPFPDGRMAYHVYCPTLMDYAASTWGYTKEEAIKNIQEVIQMIIEDQAKWDEDDLKRLGVIK